MQTGPGNPDDSLMLKDDPAYQAWIQQAFADRCEAELKQEMKKVDAAGAAVGARARSSNTSSTKRARTADDQLCQEWEPDHLEMFREAKLSWPPDMKSDPELADAVKHLPRRMQEAAYWHVHRPRPDPDARTWHDLNPTLTFRSEVIGQVLTIVCTSVVLDRKMKKILSGIEIMSLQGYPRDLCCEAYATNTHLTELAGNSFNIYAFIAMILALFVALDLDIKDDKPTEPTATGGNQCSVDGEPMDEEEEQAESEACSDKDDAVDASSNSSSSPSSVS